jgi:hypothetical protein
MPPRRVKGTIVLRGRPVRADGVLLRLAKLLVPLALVALAPAGCGSSEQPAAVRTTPTKDPAAEFAVRIQAELARRRFRRAWRSLHPAQQRFLSAGALADCWTRSRTSKLEQRLRFEAAGVRDEPWRVAGGSAKPQPSKAVLVRVRAVGSGEVLDSFTQHVFELEKGSRWIVSAAIVRQFRAGACGST